MATTALNPQVKTFLEQPHRNFIGGEWVDATSGSSIEVENPSTEEVIAEVGAGSRDDVDRAVVAAREALKGPWSSMSSAEAMAGMTVTWHPASRSTRRILYLIP